MCTVDGCGRDVYALGMCQRHYERDLYARNPEPVRRRQRELYRADPERVRQRIKAAAWARGARVGRSSKLACGYVTAHKRVYRTRGRATDYACARCGAQAHEWAYRSGSAQEIRGTHQGREVSWSPNPLDYEPLCLSDHRREDIARARSREP